MRISTHPFKSTQYPWHNVSLYWLRHVFAHFLRPFHTVNTSETVMMRRRANFGYKESAPRLLSIVHKYSRRSFHSTTAENTAKSKPQSVRETLGRNDAVANGALFESQVLAGSSSLNGVYVCLDSQKVTANIARDTVKDGGSKLFTEGQLATITRGAVILHQADPADKKLARYATMGVSGDDMQIDGFFWLDSTDHDEALAKLQAFLMQTATQYCKLDSDSDLSPLLDGGNLCPHAPPFVIIEVCVTGEKAAHKMLQLVRDYLVSKKNLAGHLNSKNETTKPQPDPLLILYLNGDVAKANAAISNVRDVLKKEVEQNDDEQTKSLRTVFKNTVVLYTPFRNVYEADKWKTV